MADFSTCSEDDSESDDCVIVEEEELSNNDTSKEARHRSSRKCGGFFTKMSEKSVKCNLCNRRWHISVELVLL